MFDERTMEMRVRGMTTAEAVIEVLWWRSLASDRVLAALYERQRTLHFVNCECSSRRNLESDSECRQKIVATVEL